MFQPSMQNIYRYFIISLFVAVAVNFSTAQNKTPASAKSPEVKWWNGFLVKMDVASPVITGFSDTEHFGMEGSVQFNLKRKIFPVYEIGFGGADKLSSNEVRFNTNGIFQRIGIDFGLLKQSSDKELINNMLTGGVRLGWSNFSYDLTNLSLSDDYWGGSQTLNFEGQSATKTWYEIVVGIQVQVYKNFYLGWNIRNRHFFKEDTSGNIAPWYIPGYGKTGSSNTGFNYTIGYHF
ncbi:MAG TPA: DUF6048 family protein [Paludibacteraceae bacterium]|nr:DUF6048 family protein [Paludibacteraceae bacterium]HRS24644.1 DUF6048 family protein [Paludibacteraceae bacterium]HRT79065.1 DUF6048 family protein [Paludibacteraceae bacterium]